MAVLALAGNKVGKEIPNEGVVFFVANLIELHIGVPNTGVWHLDIIHTEHLRVNFE